MTTTGPQSQTQPTTSTGTGPTGAQTSSRASGRSGAELESSQGKTTVADVVVSKIAALAAREVPGIHGFGGGASRAFGAVRERIPGARSSSTQGVTVEVGERQAAVDLVVVVEYGAPIVELARAVRRNVIGAVEQMTGLDVVEVNINVTDLHLPGGEEDEGEQPAQPPRVS